MSKLNIKDKTQGFTIIEVVLVLAIAGLIFLIVFLALPGLQRSRRDTQRKSDLGNMAAALENYASNNNGQYPSSIGSGSDANCGTGKTSCTISQFLTNFSPTTDPQGKTYTVKSTAGSSAGDITYYQGGSCSGNAAVSTGGTGNAQGYAISMIFENGSQCKSVTN